MNQSRAINMATHIAKTGALVFDELPAPEVYTWPRWRILTSEALAPVSVALAKMGYLAIIGAFGITERDSYERQGKGGEEFLPLPRWSIAALPPGFSITPERIREIGARIDRLAVFDPIAVVGAGYAIGDFMETKMRWEDVSAEGYSVTTRKLHGQLLSLASERWRYDTASTLVAGVGIPIWSERGWETLADNPAMYSACLIHKPWIFRNQAEIYARAKSYGDFVSITGERL